MKIIFTGFEPFGNNTYNPSWEAVSRLPDKIKDCDIRKFRLPVEYDTVGNILSDILNTEKPDALICVGQAGGRTAITPEMVAINLKGAPIPDNAGITYLDKPVIENGENAYFSTLPIRAIVATLQSKGIPCSISLSAGSFVCNVLFYHAMRLTSREIPAGFIHIPFESCQALDGSKPSMPLSIMIEGLTETATLIAANLGQNGSL